MIRCLTLQAACSEGSDTIRKGHLRARTSCRLGRPWKAPSIRDNLWHWFCSIRGSVKTRIPLACLKTQANQIRMMYLATAAALRRPAEVPTITYRWLLAFRTYYHISLRMPNKRWKVPKDVFEQRLRIFWLNLIRMRYWLYLATGHEPQSIDSFDQKPFHVNESGSKLQRAAKYS